MKPAAPGEADREHWLSGKVAMFIVGPTESKDWLGFRVDSTINAYASSIQGASFSRVRHSFDRALQRERQFRPGLHCAGCALATLQTLAKWTAFCLTWKE